MKVVVLVIAAWPIYYAGRCEVCVLVAGSLSLSLSPISLADVVVVQFGVELVLVGCDFGVNTWG